MFEVVLRLFLVVSRALKFWFVLLLFWFELGCLWMFHVAFRVICKLFCFRLFQVVSNGFSCVVFFAYFTIVLLIRRHVKVDLGSLLFIHWFGVVLKPCWVV